MIGAIIGAATAAAGGITNAIQGAREARKQRRELDRRERENTLWYDRRYNEAGTQRADAQLALTRLADQQQRRMQSARGHAAVGGTTQAALAAEREAANKAMGDTVGAINARQDARRDAVEQRYMAQRDAISDARIKGSAARAAGMAQAAGVASQMGAAIAAADLGRAERNKTESAGVAATKAKVNDNPFKSQWDYQDNEEPPVAPYNLYAPLNGPMA